MKTKILSKLKIFIGLCLIVLSLYRCAGPDVPWQLVQDDTGDGEGPTNPKPPPPPPPPPPPNGCVINFKWGLQLVTRIDINDTAYGNVETITVNGKSESARLVKSDPKDFSSKPIPLIFNKNNVTMDPARFPTGITFPLSSYDVSIKQVGTAGQGTYDTNSMTIDGLSFEVIFQSGTSTLADFTLNNLKFTTDKVTQTGAFGSLEDTGKPIQTTDKSLKLIVGTTIPVKALPIHDFDNAALMITFSGTLDSLPDPNNCQGSGGDSGVQVREIVKDKDGNPQEIDLTNDTLDFGRVFVPEKGKDTNTQTDPNFTITKTLKVTSFDSDVSLTAKNENGFNVPAVQISKGASKQFDVTFALPEVSYDMTNPPPTANESSSIIIGNKTVQLKGIAKRASAELTVVGEDGNAPPTPLDLGTGSATVIDGKLQCDDTAKRPILSKRVIIGNTGVRPLTILGAQTIGETTPTADLGCDATAYTDELSNIREFKLMSDKTLYTGGATDGSCSGFGSFPCTLNPGNGKINLVAAYKPVNANTGKDTANAKIRYQYAGSPEATPLLIPLTAAVVPDRSNAIVLQPDGSNFQIRSGGNAKINIQTATDKVPAPETGYAHDQKFNIVNSTIELKVDSIEITGKDKDHFSIAGTKPTTIPKVGVTPLANFTIHTTAPATATKSDVYLADLTIKFTPNEPGATQGTFKVSLVGLVDHVPLTGYVKLYVDRMATYIDNENARVIPSIAFRNPKSSAWGSGPIYFKFDPKIDGVTDHPYLRKVTVEPNQNFDPVSDTDDNILKKMTQMKQAEREDLVRLYTVRLTTGNQTQPEINDRHEHACTEPSDASGGLNKDYQEGECSYFYYSLASKRDKMNPTQPDPQFVGFYDDRTGEMLVTNINLRMMNPYHGSLPPYYATSQASNQYKLNALFNTTVTTLPIDRLNLANPYTGTPDEIKGMTASIPMADGSKIDESQIAIPDKDAQDYILSKFSCTLGQQWAPWLTPDDTPFGCYMTSNSPYYIKGFPATPLVNGDYGIVLSLLMRFNAEPKAGGPAKEQVPFFLSTNEFWASIQGRLVQCEANWTNCKPDKNNLSDYTK